MAPTHLASWPALQPLQTRLTVGPVVVGANKHVCPAFPRSHLSCMVTADLSMHQAKQDQAGVGRFHVHAGRTEHCQGKLLEKARLTL